MAKRLSKKDFAIQKQAEMKDTIDEAMNKVSNYTQNAEDFVQYLDFMSNMYDYSPRNQMLLSNQYEGAYGVAGKRQFEAMGFKVHDNEKALKVLAPVFKKYTIDENKKWIPLDRPNKAQQEKIESGEYKVKQKLSYFKFADVYDIGQTDAKAEDYPKMFPNRPYTFDERNLNEKYPNLKSAIISFARKEGLIVNDEQHTGRLGNAKGAYVHDTNQIFMRPHLSKGEYMSTLNHEIAHGQLHRNSSLDTPTKELEAEMTAYVTNKHFGLDTSEKAISYMADWTKNLEKLNDKETIKVIERVSKTSRTMIAGIEEHYENEKKLSLDNQKNVIQEVRLGDMSFNYKNLKSLDVKEFTLLDEVDSLSLKFNDNSTIKLYENAEQKQKFHKQLNSNTSVNLNDMNMKDYLSSAVNNIKDIDSSKDEVNEVVEKKARKKIDKKNSIEL